MDIHGSEQAQYTWISMIERGVYRKKPQPRTWEFYMKLGNILLHSKLLNVGIYSLRYLDQFLSQRILAICVNTHVSRCPRLAVSDKTITQVSRFMSSWT
jgi:hypothetical protein